MITKQLLSDIKALETVIKLENSKLKAKNDELLYLIEYNKQLEQKFKNYQAAENIGRTLQHSQLRTLTNSIVKKEQTLVNFKQQKENKERFLKIQNQYLSKRVETALIKNLQQNQRKQIEMILSKIEQYSELNVKCQKLKAMRDYINQDCKIGNKNKPAKATTINKNQQIVRLGYTAKMKSLIK